MTAPTTWSIARTLRTPQLTYIASCTTKGRVREVFTLTLREAQHRRNTCPQYILPKRSLPTTVGTHIWNHLQLLLPHHRHVIQTNHKCEETGPIAILHTDVGGGSTGDTTSLDHLGTTLHLMRVTPTTFPSYNTLTGPTNHSWKTICDRRQSGPIARNPPMAKSVKPTTCSGALTSNPYHKARRQEARPTTDHWNKWRMLRRPRYRRSSYWHPADLKLPYDPGHPEHRATYGCYPHRRHASSAHRCYRRIR